MDVPLSKCNENKQQHVVDLGRDMCCALIGFKIFTYCYCDLTMVEHDCLCCIFSWMINISTLTVCKR